MSVCVCEGRVVNMEGSNQSIKKEGNLQTKSVSMNFQKGFLIIVFLFI